MVRRKHVVHLTLLCLINVCDGYSEGQKCYKSQGAEGVCISARRCGESLEILRGPRPLNYHSVKYLMFTNCGFSGKTPLVCCFRSPETTTPRVDTASPEDVSEHDNLRLLPFNICGVRLRDKITKGNKVGLFDYPWMARIAYLTEHENQIEYRCAGTVISDRYILTAAHCLVNLPDNLNPVGVTLGDHDTETDIDCEMVAGAEICAPPAQNFDIEDITVHQSFSRRPDYHNDIALIRLNGKADFSPESVRPICLPVGVKQQSATMEGKKLAVTGWGTTENKPSSSVLRCAEVPVVALGTCILNYKNIARVNSNQLCAGGAGVDSCSGDSGGPLMTVGEVNNHSRVLQIGIVSFGPKECGRPDRPGVYTKVGSYMKWILDNICP